MEYLKIALSKYNEFQGGGAQMALFWMSVLVLVLGGRKDENRAIKTLLYYVALFLLIFFCPISAWFIMEFCIEQNVYWRMLWLLPEVVVLAYVLTGWVMKNQKWRRWVAALLCVLLIAAGGTGFWSYAKVDFATGLEKLPRGVQAICETLQTSKEQYQEEEICVIVPDELISSIRQYDATIKMPYGRAVLKGERNHIIHDVLTQENFSAQLLAHWAKQYQCNYLVYPVSEDNTVETSLTEAGYETVGQVEQYQIYYLPQEKDDWKLVQYSDVSGQQGCFYTLYSQKTDSLIVIDGGWKENETQVRRVIKAYGGKVDAWFITHYDNDHVDAFNAIYAQKNGIKIKKIYVTPLDYTYYMDTLRDWDTPESYARFLEITQQDDKVVALKRGDKKTICGLQLQVFNAYDEEVAKANEKEKDLPNIASLVFKLTGENHSVLFCGDCHGSTMENMLWEKYKTDMQADYIQLGHHGNHSFSGTFYKRLQPEAVLFDAPQWLMTGETYTAAELKSFFVLNDVKTYDYTTGINILDF